MRLSRAIRSSAESLESRLLLSTYTVTSAADSGPGTLRDAIANSSADTIQFSVALKLWGPRSNVAVQRFPTVTRRAIGALTKRRTTG